MSSDISGVVISVERLKELEKYEAELALQKKDKAEKLKNLNELKKINPEKHSKKMLDNYYKNKDEINAKRREQYKAKKSAQESEKAQNQIV